MSNEKIKTVFIAIIMSVFATIVLYLLFDSMELNNEGLSDRMYKLMQVMPFLLGPIIGIKTSNFLCKIVFGKEPPLNPSE